MKKLSSTRYLCLSAVLILTGAVAASAADRFSMVVGSHDLLTIFNAKGDPKVELPLPSISQTVVVDGATCQISYGRDANNLLTAIIAPNPAQPQDLHFTVLGKSIDTDKDAVVTLTFAKNLSGVTIDPGYVGEVEVNSHQMHLDSAINRGMQHAPLLVAYSPTPSTSGTVSTDPNPAFNPSTPPAKTKPAPAPANAPVTAVTLPVPAPATPIAANQPANTTDASEAAQDRVSDHAPLPLQVNTASQMPYTATATPGPSTVSVAGSDANPKQHSLYWAEPITPPNGPAPQVASNEMKLVEMDGSVSVKLPGGDVRDGSVGMIVPSGSTISTSAGSSAALFMGGVNSVRLMPDTEVQVTQQLDGSLRKTVLALQRGTVFNRVGHHDGEKQSYQVETPQGVSVAKGTEFADSLTNGHHYVFVVKGIVATIMNGIQTGTLIALPNNVASGAMPPAVDGNNILFAILTHLQPFQHHLQEVIAHINNGTATPAELGYYNALKNTFTVLVDDVYDPTHPNSFLGAFTSQTGFGDSTHSDLERPQDFALPNPNNEFNGLTLPSHDADTNPFSTPAATPTTPGQLPTT
jgi:FecR protein